MSDKSPQILIIPIDNRPVCYDLLLQAAHINKDVKIFLPDISLLGGLDTYANISSLNAWVKNVLDNNDIDIVITALDTIAYGGLILSRKSVAKFEEIQANIDNFISIIKNSGKNVKLYGMSSIMRISDNNYNQEEKSYWENYGKDLFKYSYLSHKLLKDYDLELESELIQLAKKIPFEVIDDYLNTRKRNFDINSYYIDLVKSKIINSLIFSQDDTAEFGFNVEEKELLQKLALKELVMDKINIKTGADEMILALLARSLVDFYGENIKISPDFFDDKAKKIISRYEDISIEKSVSSTIQLCGATISDNKNADINLILNLPNKVQNDICLGILEDTESTKHSDKIIEHLSTLNKKYMIGDIKNANGADNIFLDKLLSEIQYNPDLMYGFAAWNTTGNTLGTVISIGIIKYLAQKYNVYDEEAFKKSQFIRFMDDWAYQANVRRILREKGETNSVVEEMQPYKQKISQWLNYNTDTDYSFPWNRTFEIRIDIN